MIIKKKIWIEPFQCERQLHIYLPDKKAENERFPVLYMFDGHNLFFDTDATYGKCWGLKDYLDNHDSRLIVVGIECNHEGNERLNEFSPYDYQDYDYGFVSGKGIQLIEWMVKDLKSWVDQSYPTLVQREYTYAGGSSMGGLMSLYMALKYSDVYSKIISVSPHIYPLYKQLREDLKSPVHPNTEIYISWGGHEYPDPHILAMATDQNLQIIRALLKKSGVDVIPHVFKNDDHSESAWQKELPVWMEELRIGKEFFCRNESLEIETMQLKHLPAVLKMQKQLDDAMMSYLPEALAQRNGRLPMRYWEGMLNHTYGFGLIAKINNKAVGYLTFEKTRSCISYLYVHESWRKQGIGTALIQACKKMAYELGQPYVTLNVLVKNEGAKQLYQRLGFYEYENTLIDKL